MSGGAPGPERALAWDVLTVGRVGAGTGCRYLTEQIAVGKDDFAELSPAQALTYYSDTRAHGESPGRWLGRGLGTLGLAGPVRASELENLIGKARHPHFDAAARRRRPPIERPRYDRSGAAGGARGGREGAGSGAGVRHLRVGRGPRRTRCSG